MLFACKICLKGNERHTPNEAELLKLGQVDALDIRDVLETSEEFLLPQTMRPSLMFLFYHKLPSELQE